MRRTVICLGLLLGITYAAPNGVYHQEYNYKASSATYNNNELQHKTDDQGFYSKDGDFEGRVKPRVSSNSEHSEYVNPKLRDYNAGAQYAASTGQYPSNYGSQYGTSGYGSNSYGSQYGSGSSYGSSSAYDASSAYGSSSNYAATSSLQSISSQVENELQRELQSQLQSNLALNELEANLRRRVSERLEDAISRQYGQQSIRNGLSYTISGGRVQPTANFRQQDYLDLRRRLEDELLQRLRSEYRTNSHYSSSSSSQRQEEYNDRYHIVQTTTYRPYVGEYGTQRPVYNVQPIPIAQQPIDVRYTPVSHPDSITTIASRVQNILDQRLNRILDEAEKRYFSESSRYSGNVDVILQQLQDELRRNVTYFIDDEIRTQYGNQAQRDGYMYTLGPAGQYSTQYNYKLDHLRDLKRQIETNLLEKLNRDFAIYKQRSQTRHQSSSFRETNSGFDYTTIRTVTVPLHIGPNYRNYDYTTPRYDIVPSSEPFISGTKGYRGYRNSYSAAGGYQVAGSAGQNFAELQSQLQSQLSREIQEAIARNEASRSSAYGYGSGQTYDTSYQRLYDELNRNLSRQLQAYEYGAVDSGYGSGYNIQEAELAQLRAQLQRDLSSQLQRGLQQSFSSSSSYSSHSSSASGGMIGGEDCVGDDPTAYRSYRIRRSPYQSYQPYRSRPLGVSTNTGGYGGYSSGYGGYYPQRPTQQQVGQQVDDSDLSQHVETGFGQQEDNSDLTQQVEDSGFGNIQAGSSLSQSSTGRLSNQHNVDTGFGGLQVGAQGNSGSTPRYTTFGGSSSYQKPTALNQQGQQEDNSDLTQQVVDSGFGSSYNRPSSTGYSSGYSRQNQRGQQNSGLTQQVEDTGFGSIQVGAQGRDRYSSQRPSGYSRPSQQNSGLTQQVNNNNYENLQVDSHTTRKPTNQYSLQSEIGQQEDNSDLTQQVEDSGFGNHHSSTSNQRDLQTQNSDLTQQVENTGSSQRRSGYSRPIQRQTSDLTQQVEDNTFGNLQAGSHSKPKPISGSYPTSEQSTSHSKPQTQFDVQTGLGQQEDNSDLTQQVEDQQFDVIKPLKPLSQQVNPLSVGQQEDDSDLTQQVEENGFGNLQTGSQSRPNKPSSGYSRPSTHNQQQRNDQLNQQQTNDLSQHTEDSGFGNLQVGSSSNSKPTSTGQLTEIGQQEDNSDLTQQTEDIDFGSFHSKPKPVVGINKREDDTDLNQQVEDNQFNVGSVKPLKPLSQTTQQDDKLNLNQQVDTLSNVGQQEDDTDLTQQQVVDNIFGSSTPNSARGDQQSAGVDSTNNLLVASSTHSPVKPLIAPASQQNQPEDNFLTLGNTPERQYRPTGYNNNYDFHQQEINRQNQYQHSIYNTNGVNSQTLRPLNQVSGQFQPVNQRPQVVGLPQSSQPFQGQVQVEEDLGIDGLNSNTNSQREVALVGQGNQNTDSVSLQSGTPEYVYVPYVPNAPQQTGYQPYVPRPTVPQPSIRNQQIPQGGQPVVVPNFQPVQQGQSFGFNEQGQLTTSQLTREEADRQAELLLEQIRKIKQSQSRLNGHSYGETVLSQRPISTNNVDSNQNQFSGSLNANANPIIVSPVTTENINLRPVNREEMTTPREVTLTQNQLEVAKQLEDDIVKQLDVAIDNQYKSAASYSYAYSQLKEQLKQNLTEFISGATEPGLSTYSEKIQSNFDNSQIKDLQTLLERRCSQRLEQRLQEVYYGYSYSSSSSSHRHHHRHSYSYGDNTQESSHSSGSDQSYSQGSRYHGTRYHGSGYGNTDLNYARPNQVDDTNFETAVELQPQQPQYADHVQDVVPTTNFGQSPNVETSPEAKPVVQPELPRQQNSYGGGVKGGRRFQSQYKPVVEPEVQPDINESVNAQVEVVHPDEQVEIVEPELTTTEKPGFWRRFGNKVAAGAKKIKDQVGL